MVHFIAPFQYSTSAELACRDDKEIKIDIFYTYVPATRGGWDEPPADEEFSVVQYIEHDTGNDITADITEEEAQKLFDDLTGNATDHIPEPPEPEDKGWLL